MRRLLILAALALAACGAPSAPLTVTTVTEALTKAGLTVADVQNGPAGETVPKGYSDHATLTLAGKPGQVFICPDKKTCDAIYAYFDAVKGLGGPNYFQSGGGLIVGQFNDQLDPAAAQAAKTAIAALP